MIGRAITYGCRSPQSKLNHGIHDRKARAEQEGAQDRVLHETLAIRVNRGVTRLQGSDEQTPREEQPLYAGDQPRLPSFFFFLIIGPPPTSPLFPPPPLSR